MSDLVAELLRIQNSYVTRMSGGFNSIIVRSKDDELGECYRLMAVAASRIVELESAFLYPSEVQLQLFRDAWVDEDRKGHHVRSGLAAIFEDLA